jgi:AbrB family looped-hinge helix DNA binding protein
MAVQLKISANGRVCIPAEVRARLGIKEGDILTLEEHDDGLVLTTLDQRIAQAQAIFRKMRKGKPGSAVDDFLREKREQQQRDEAHDRELYGE